MRSLLGMALLCCLAASCQGMNMGGAHPSVNMTDPCYTNPADASCRTFRRMHMEWMDDLMSLCSAMPFMVGCQLWNECKPLIAQKNPVTNNSMAFGTYCGMPSLVGNICEEMPRMKGCEAILALCTPESVVAQCFNPGPAPNVLWTYEVKQDVDALCNATGLPVCANCTVGKPPVGGWAACPNPTAVLTQLCYKEFPNPPMPACWNLTRFCANSVVKAAYPKTCNVPDPQPTGKTCPSGPAPILKLNAAGTEECMSCAAAGLNCAGSRSCRTTGCTQCGRGFFLGRIGTPHSATVTIIAGVKKEYSQCKECSAVFGPNALNCSVSGALSCKTGWSVGGPNGTCKQCTDPNCTSCRGRTPACQQCVRGYSVSRGRCVRRRW